MIKYAALLAAAALLAVPAIAKDRDKDAAVAPKVAMPGTIILFHGQNLDGTTMVVDQDRTLIQIDWTVGSIAIPAGERWQVCLGRAYTGECHVLDASMTGMGRVDVKSVRRQP